MVTLHGEHEELAVGTAVTPVSESVAAIAIIVLTVLGLVDVVPGAMVAIATIVVGAAILLQGAQEVGEYSRLITTGGATASMASDTWGGGVTLEFLAGGVGIVLGILALFSHTPILAPAALIVFGGTLLLIGSVAARRTPALSETGAREQVARAIAAQMSGVASGAQIMIGIAAIVLGILALIPIHDTVLTLVGLLAVGASLLMSAVASGGLMMNVLRS